jgi:hypothetical protein
LVERNACIGMERNVYEIAHSAAFYNGMGVVFFSKLTA